MNEEVIARVGEQPHEKKELRPTFFPFFVQIFKKLPLLLLRTYPSDLYHVRTRSLTMIYTKRAIMSVCSCL